MSHDDIAERAVLGAMMLSDAAIEDACQAVSASDFYQPAHEAIFDHILRVRAMGKRASMEAVALSLGKVELQRVGGASYLHTLTTHLPAVGNADWMARQVSDHAVRRRLAEAGNRLVALAESDDTDVDELADKARADVDAAVGQRARQVEWIGDTIYSTIDDLERKDVLTPTPWPSLDHLIGGTRPGALYVVGARPGKGKSMVAAMLAVNMARHGKAVAFASLEMSRHEINRRWIAQMGAVSMTALETRHLSKTDWQNVSEAPRQLADLPLSVDDRSGQTVWDIRSHARSVARRKPLGMIVVDYLQLLSTPRTSARLPRHEQVAEMSRSMKRLAQELECSVVCLSQLNRQSEARNGGVPALADLRESGAVEQDCDVALLLHRDEDKEPETLHVAVAKNRHGPTGAVRLDWDGEHALVREHQWRPSYALEGAS